MKIKPTITKSLNDRKIVLTRQAEDLRSQLGVSEFEDNLRRRTLAELEAEIADIDEFLSAPTEE